MGAPVRGRFKAAPVVGLDLTVAGEHEWCAVGGERRGIEEAVGVRECEG